MYSLCVLLRNLFHCIYLSSNHNSSYTPLHFYIINSAVTTQPIHKVSAFTIGNALTDTWKGAFRPFHHFIYAHVCLLTLAQIKIRKIIKISHCNRPKITLKCCWHRMEKNLQKTCKIRFIYGPI